MLVFLGLSLATVGVSIWSVALSHKAFIYNLSLMDREEALLIVYELYIEDIGALSPEVYSYFSPKDLEDMLGLLLVQAEDLTTMESVVFGYRKTIENTRSVILGFTVVMLFHKVFADVGRVKSSYWEGLAFSEDSEEEG